MTSTASTHSALVAADCAPGSVLYGEIVEFLYREAELLDSNRFGDWLSLLAEDIHYVMPVRTTQFRAKGEGFQDVAFFEENFASLRTRVKRLETDFAWAETPPSRTRHFITNILADPAIWPVYFRCDRVSWLRARGPTRATNCSRASGKMFCVAPMPASSRSPAGAS